MGASRFRFGRRAVERKHGMIVGPFKIQSKTLNGTNQLMKLAAKRVMAFGSANLVAA